MDQKHARSSHLLISLSLTLFLFFNFSLCSALCNQNDKNTILQIKTQFGNPPSLESWNPNTDCCNDWSGYMYADVAVNCDNQGHVIDLSIDGADDISGNIPSALGDLTSLQTLKLYNMAHLSGPITQPICKLTNLWSLTLAFTNLSGPIPDCLAQLKKLTYVDLSSNRLTGYIPPSISQLPNLLELNLMFNKLYGLIPDFTTQINNGIYSINLINNNLFGPIPASLGLLSNLSLLALSGNQLTGSIPPSLGHVSSLRWLDLAGNRLTGLIPDSFGSLTDSIYLQLQNNQLFGPIPKSLGRVNTIWLDLSMNRLIGDASFLFGRNKSWTEKININNNCLGFDFSHVELPEHMSILNISHNRIYGSLPEELGRLWSLDVSYNQLCGPIPSSCARFGPSCFAENKCLCGPPLAACK